jgi:hypothetical protein
MTTAPWLQLDAPDVHLAAGTLHVSCLGDCDFWLARIEDRDRDGRNLAHALRAHAATAQPCPACGSETRPLAWECDIAGEQWTVPISADGRPDLSEAIVRQDRR